MWLWLIIAVVLFAVSTYCIGRFDLDGGDPAGLLWLSFICSLLWPLALGIVVVAGPFAGLFWLGDRKRKQKEKSTTNK